MSISIIMTTCNRPIEIVRRAVDSVLAQTLLTDTQLIIVNDYPKDKLLSEKISGLADYVREKLECTYLEMQENMGACEARNRGVMEAKGEYLAFLDDDDIWMPRKLEKQLDYMKSHKAVMVTGYVEEHINGTVRICNRKPLPEENPMEKLLEYNYIGGCSVPLMSREAFDRVGGFDSQYKSSQDYCLWLKLLKTGDIGFIEEPLVIYEAGRDGITGNPVKRKQGWNRLLRDFKSDFKKYPIARKNFCYTAAVVMKENGRIPDSLIFRIRGKFGL